MARKTDRKGLGRGLSALLADTADPEAAAGAAAPRGTGLTVDIDRIQANPDQPRRSFGEEVFLREKTQKDTGISNSFDFCVNLFDDRRSGRATVIGGAQRGQSERNLITHA